jgi:hypothetical protein
LKEVNEQGEGEKLSAVRMSAEHQIKTAGVELSDTAWLVCEQQPKIGRAASGESFR